MPFVRAEACSSAFSACVLVSSRAVSVERFEMVELEESGDEMGEEASDSLSRCESRASQPDVKPKKRTEERTHWSRASMSCCLVRASWSRRSRSSQSRTSSSFLHLMSVVDVACERLISSSSARKQR